MAEPSDSRSSISQILRQALSSVRRLFPWPPRGPGQLPSRDLRRKTAEVQLALVKQALGGGNAGLGAFWGDHAEKDGFFLYRPGHVLLMADNLEILESFFQERAGDYASDGRIADELPGGVLLYEVPRRADGRDDLPALLDEIDGSGRDGVARPDHLLYVTPNGWGGLCPASEPDLPPRPGPVPAMSDFQDGGADIRVSVVDTGWHALAAKNSQTPWLAAGYVGGDPDKGISNNAIKPYAGHGTFVAGVIRCLAPKAIIEHEGIFVHAGAVFESEVSKELNEAMGDSPHLISISAGCYTRNNLGLLAFEALAMALKWVEGEEAPLVVAAAGNDYGQRTFWPAAYDWVLAVGSLESTPGKIAVSDFSNVGSWVNVYAQGRNVVNAFPAGKYVCSEPKQQGAQRDFSGLAQWSGTSFATPIVTGAIAAYMSKHKVSARKARDEVLKSGKAFSDTRVLNGIAVGPPFV